MKGIALAAVVAACGGAPAAPEPALPRAAPPGPPGANGQETTVDGRPIFYGHVAQWCGRHAYAEARGYCHEDQASCVNERTERAKTEYVEIVERNGGLAKADESQRKGYAAAALDTWKPCERMTTMACFRATAVLSGDWVTMCYPTIAACDWAIGDLATSPDFKSGDARCFAYRVRE